MSQEADKTLGVTTEDGKASITVSLAQGSIVSMNNSARASVVQRYQPTGYQRYNSGDTPMYDLGGVPSDFREQVRMARKYYLAESITGTVVDVLVQFSVGPIEHITEDEGVKRFFDAIYETSNLKDAIKWSFLEYYVAGNVWPYRSLPGNKIVSRNNVEVPEYKWTVLNPEKVDIQGSLLFDQTVVTLEPNDELREFINNKDPQIRRLVNNIPSEIRKALISGGNIPIEDRQVYHISRNKQPFQKYATPFVMRNIGPLRVKEKLMQMDLSTADGVINQLVTVTVGNDTYPATQEDLERLAELLNTPSKAYALLWNHTLNVKFHKPEANLFDPKKYEQVNKDIAAGYGIARVAVPNEGKSYASDAISIKSLIQWLEWGREDISKWLEREYRIIAEENGLNTYPRVKFKRVNLQEEKSIKNILMNLFDRGALSVETLLNETDHDINVEIGRLKKELEYKKKGLFLPQSPWQQSKTQNNPVGNPVWEGPGRPDGQEDEVQRERDSQPSPHGAALRSTMGSSTTLDEAIDSYTKDLMILYLATRDSVRNKIQKTSDRDIQEDIVDASISAFLRELDNIGAKYMTDMFLYEYKDLLEADYETDQEALKWLGTGLEWNAFYASKLANDLRKNLLVSLDDSLDEPVSGVFGNEQYRIAMFGKEGMKKAKFLGEVAAVVELGYNRARWNAMFENTCDVCAARHGHVYSISELLDIFPAHNNCKCFLDYMR